MLHFVSCRQVAAQPLCTSGSAAGAQECIVSNFNNSGFTYEFSGFIAEQGPTAVRLFDPADGWGGAGLIQSMDLSSFTDARFAVDLTRNAGHGAGLFELELIDSNDNKGKWVLSTNTLVPGQVSTVVTAATLNNPNYTINGAPDLSDITAFQILGEFSSPAPFDLSFDRVKISKTVDPPDAYPGRAADASWRAVADQRIDELRKADVQINVTDLLGNTIRGATVDLEQTRHEFGFGSAVVANRLATGPPSETYKQKVAELFNISVIENNLKWPPWDGDWGSGFTQLQARNAVDRLRTRDIEVRGHAMVWPGINNMPQSLQTLLSNPSLNSAQQQQLRDAIAAHIQEIGNEFEGDLLAWDVINEPRTNHDVMDLLPEGDMAMVDWFNQAKAADAQAKLYLNEFGILPSGGGTDTSNQQLLIDQLTFLQNNGAPVDGVGLQSHFTEGDLSGPEAVWDILDRFDALGVDIQITEFDFQTTDLQLQADFTRDFMTAAFAHEGVEDFLFWGFWENAHWRPEAALFDSNWNIKPNGQAFIDRVFEDWWTDEDTLTGDLGDALIRAFKGNHDLLVSYLGESFADQITLSDGGATINVTLDIRLGDFDNDTDYACSDVDALVVEIVSGQNGATYDLTGDGLVDDDDLTEWLALAGSAELASGNSFLLGDANLDGAVDGADFLAWNSSKFTSTAAWCDGDFDANGSVDGNDFLIWNANKFQSADALSTVPEPVCGMFLLRALIMVVFTRRRIV